MLFFFACFFIFPTWHAPCSMKDQRRRARQPVPLKDEGVLRIQEQELLPYQHRRANGDLSDE